MILAPPPGRRPRLETTLQLSFENHLPLAAPKLFTRGFTIICGVVLVVGLLGVHEITSTLELALPWFAWGAPVVAVAVVVAVRWLYLPPNPRSIHFGGDAVQLPGGRNSRRTFEIPYEKIRTVVPLSSRGQPALVVDGPGKTHMFLAGDFPHPESWRMLWARLMRLIAARPGGDEQVEKMRRLANLSQQTSSIDAGFTKKLFWVITAIFGAQLLFAPGVDVLEFLYFGANSRVMVLQEGQLWRVVTANLLHGGGVHYAVNAFALYFLGTYCERLLGAGRTVVLTLGTALAGATASLIGSAAMFSVGISTALFGLLGAYFAVHLRYGSQLPPPYRQSKLWWGVILGLNLVLSVAVPIIDAWGHFGGFVAGVGLGWLMTLGETQFQPQRPSGAVTNFAGAALVALFAASSFFAVGYALGDHPDDEVAFAQTLVEQADEQEPAMLVQIVHQWTDHSPRPSELDPVLVSLAEAAYARGDDLFVRWRAASAIVRLAEQMGDPFDREAMQSGIDHFERAAHHHDDPDARRVVGDLLLRYVTEAGPLHLADSPFERVEVGDDGVSLRPAAPVSESRRVYVIAHAEGTTNRLIRRCIPPGESAGANSAPVGGLQPDEWTFQLAMVTSAEDCSPEASERWRTTVLTEPDEPT